MRVISGKFRSKKILDPKDKTTRPLRDYVKESIFNIIEHTHDLNIELKNSVILDFFSSTGSFGIECISRGASKVYFFENYKSSLQVLKKNIELLKISYFTRVIEKSSYDFDLNNLENNKVDIVFLDPPFKENDYDVIIQKIIKFKILKKDSVIIIHRNKKNKDRFNKNLKIVKQKTYGISEISFFKLVY